MYDFIGFGRSPRFEAGQCGLCLLVGCSYGGWWRFDFVAVVLVLQTMRETILLSTSRAVYRWVTGGIDYRFAFRMGAVGLQEAADFGFGWGSRGRGILFTACGSPAAFVGAFVGGFGAVVEAVCSIPSLVSILDRRE